MKTRHVHLTAILLTALTASPVWAARDPFWPIGYEPPPPVPEPVEAQPPQEPVVTRPEPPPKPAEKPVTEAEWAAARKTLVISGFTQTVRADAQGTRFMAMVNRRMVSAGDTITLVYQEVRFLWRVEALTDRTLELAPLQAERLIPKPADLKQNK